MHDFQEEGETHLTFTSGASLLVYSNHGQGWSHGARLDGEGSILSTGYFPTSYFESIYEVCTARYEFNGKAEEHQLSFEAGCMIKIMKKSSLEWWYGKCIHASGAEGYFPASFVDVANEEQVEVAQKSTTSTTTQIQFELTALDDPSSSNAEKKFEYMLLAKCGNLGRCAEGECQTALFGKRGDVADRFCVSHTSGYYNFQNKPTT